MTEQEMIDAGLLYGIKASKYDDVSISCSSPEQEAILRWAIGIAIRSEMVISIDAFRGIK